MYVYIDARCEYGVPPLKRAIKHKFVDALMRIYVVPNEQMALIIPVLYEKYMNY